MEKLVSLEQRVSGYFESALLLDAGSEQISAIATNLKTLQSRSFQLVAMNSRLLRRIQQISEIDLTPEQKTLKKYYQNLILQGGVGLKGTKKLRFQELVRQTENAQHQFEQNILGSFRQHGVFIADAEELKGVSPELQKKASQLASKKKKNGYYFQQGSPDIDEVLKYAQSRELRQELWMLNSRIAYGDKFDNRPHIEVILKNRQEMAKLLGFSNHVDLTLQNRMAKDLRQVQDFIQKLHQNYLRLAWEEYEKLRTLAIKDGLSDFMPWDELYYGRILQQKEFMSSSEEMKPYLEIESVWKGAFFVAEKLYGVRVVENPAYDKPLPEVKTYDLMDKDGSHLGILFVDRYARVGHKSSGAWHSGEFTVHKLNGSRNPAFSWIMTNVNPIENGPTLLTPNEVRTIFHEFGHALHALMSQASYPSLAGTQTARDFVEMPSQFMENYAFSPEVLSAYARHWKTGEIMPHNLQKNMKLLNSFRRGAERVRHVFQSLLDLNLHLGQQQKSEDILEYEFRLRKELKLNFYSDYALRSTHFLHIFPWAYSAGYYSYKWSEALEAHAFHLFEKEGIFNPELADLFRKHILETGATRDYRETFEAFGGPMDPRALFHRDGMHIQEDGDLTKN